MEDEEKASWVRPFRIDIDPVTKGEYLRYLLATGQKPPYELFRSKRKKWIPVEGSLSDPVKGVSWFEARQYAKWVGKRLPTWIEMFRASRGFDERGWIRGAPSDMYPFYNNLSLYYFNKILPFSEIDLPKNAPILELIPEKEQPFTEKQRAFISKFTLSDNINTQIHSAPQFEWVEKNLEETMDELEAMLSVPQALRYSSYYHLYFDYNTGPEDSRYQLFKMGNLVPNFNLTEARRAMRDNSSASIKRIGESQDKEKPLFAPGPFLGNDPKSRRYSRSMYTHLNGEWHAGEVGFRCATDASTALAPGYSWTTTGGY